MKLWLKDLRYREINLCARDSAGWWGAIVETLVEQLARQRRASGRNSRIETGSFKNYPM